MHFNYQDLVKSIYRVFRRLEAQRKRKNFSTTLTNAEFTGHPSHGFRRIKTYIPYIQQIQTKEINLNQKSKDTYRVTLTMLMVSGGLGQIVVFNYLSSVMLKL
jgi:Malate/L-lactate dehydrogenases